MMKDRLVFEKIILTNLDAADCCKCDLGSDGGCVGNENGECEKGHIYKLVKEEPVKIQTEPTPDFIIKFVQSQMDNRLQRPIGHDLELIEKVGTWLEENKLENWQVCTKENTKVGDEVRVIENRSIRTIEHIFTYNSTHNMDCIANHKNPYRSYPSLIGNYEIDLNNTEGK